VFIENLSYALVQVLHNFGAAGAVAIPLSALAADQAWAGRQRPLLWLVLLAWGIQALSGSGFGAVSYYFYGRFPDLTDIAVTALGIKILCTILGLAIAGFSLRARTGQGADFHPRGWQALAGLGLLALTAAAFLRWFS
jgi:hypothetical protein